MSKGPLLCAATLALLGSCASEGTHPLELSWRLADGRRCTDAGVSTVELRIGDAEQPLGRFRCADGLEPLAVSWSAAPDQGVLAISAHSPEGAALYGGELEAGVLDRATVVLYARAAR